MSGNPFDDPAVRRQFDAQREQLESLPAFRQSRAETNRNLLVESGLVSTNVLVNALPTPTLRAYIRLLRSSRSFGCDVLGSDALKHEDDQNVFALPWTRVRGPDPGAC